MDQKIMKNELQKTADNRINPSCNNLASNIHARGHPNNIFFNLYFWIKGMGYRWFIFDILALAFWSYSNS